MYFIDDFIVTAAMIVLLILKDIEGFLVTAIKKFHSNKETRCFPTHPACGIDDLMKMVGLVRGLRL